MKTEIHPEIELDHIGIATSDLSENSVFWNALGWGENPTTEVVEDQKVKVAMLPLKNGANIELLEATDSSSAVAKFISKRGPGIHHICLRVKNIESLLNKLKNAGVKLINETPVKGAHQCLVAFVHPSSTGGVLVELSERMKK